jgi:hypothetical protein
VFPSGSKQAPARLTAASLAAAALLWAAGAPAWEQGISPYGARLRLRAPALLGPASLPPGLAAAVGDAQARQALESALATWARPACTGLRVVPPGRGGDGARGAATLALRWVPPGAWSHEETAAAYTLVDLEPSSGNIRAATIELNAAYTFSAGGEGVDLEATLLHEIGHALGLAHSPARGSVMHGGRKPGEAPRRALSDDDERGLCSLYPRTPAPDQAAVERAGDASGPPEATGNRWPGTLAGLAAMAALAALARSRRAGARPRGGGSGK